MGYLDETGLSRVWNRIKAYIQSLNYTSNIGTVTGITMNNTSYSPVEGDVDIGTVVTDVSDKADDADVVHIEGAENITGVKTFVGNKTVKFKQSSNSDKIGFTCYNKSDVEFGNFEVLPQDRAINLGIYNITSTPANDFLVGFKVQAKDSTGVLHKFGLRAPSRLGDSTYAEHYIPVIINNKEADNTGSITLSASDVGALPSTTSIPDDSNLVHKVHYDDYNYINETDIAVSGIRIDAADVRGRLEINDEYNGEIYLNDDNDHRWGMIKGDWGETLQQALDARNNIQADWNQTTTTAADYIKNKPTIPTVYAWAQAATKPSYTATDVGAVPTTRTVNGKALSADISLTASDVGALPSSTVIPAAQVNSDWNASSGVAQILNKPTIPIVPTNLSSFTDDLGSNPTHTHSQYLTSETEPDFNGSAAATITSSDISNWNGKTSNVGTITGITMNGSSKGTSGVVDLGTVITEHQSLTNYVQKSNTSGLLKSDGTVDTNTYLTTETEPAYT